MDLKPVDLHPEAVDEAAEARASYDAIDPKRGRRFADELDQAIDKIGGSPSRWPRHRHGTRFILLPHFPYLVIYRDVGESVQGRYRAALQTPSGLLEGSLVRELSENVLRGEVAGACEDMEQS